MMSLLKIPPTPEEMVDIMKLVDIKQRTYRAMAPEIYDECIADSHAMCQTFLHFDKDPNDRSFGTIIVALTLNTNKEFYYGFNHKR